MLAFRPAAGGPEVTATVSPDGAFEVAGLLDETYRFHESSLGNFAGSVRSIRSASGESLDEFRLRPADSPVGIVLAGDGPRVRGRVLGPDGVSPDQRVVLIPDDSGRKDLYRESGTAADGTFAFLLVAPGAYTLFAWDFVEDGAWWNTEFLEAQKELGTPVRVQEADVEIDVPLIPADEGGLP